MSRSRKTFFNGKRASNGAPFRRTTPEYPSADNGGCDTSKQESQQYTGTYVKGIATLHKSNLVPVTNGEQAKDTARMRR